jgi:hypothetical protein
MKARVKGKFAKIPDGYMSVEDHKRIVEDNEKFFNHRLESEKRQRISYVELSDRADESFRTGFIVGASSAAFIVFAIIILRTCVP